MDNEKAKYVIDYFSNLLTSAEGMAIKHTNSRYKLNLSNSSNTNVERIYREKGWLTSDQTVLDLLKDGYDSFELNTANRIINQNPDKVFFNNCPICNKLARTPFAKQCRHCGHSWRDLTVAQFTLEGSIQITGRHFFLLGKITKGKITQGQYMDLTMLGLNRRPKIEIIDFVLKLTDGKGSEDIGLGTNELTVEDQQYINKIVFSGLSFDIITKR